MTNETQTQMLIPSDDQTLLYTVAGFDNPFDNTSIVVMMIMAWIILIICFSLCCCAQCLRGGGIWSSKWLTCGLHGAASERGDDWYDNNSITTVAIDMDRTNNTENVEICRSFPPSYEVESLPSYTIVSGLPTYDDAIEEFRKAGIILTPPMPVIKIFEANEKSKDSSFSNDNNINEADNVSVSSVNTCSCGNVISNNIANTQSQAAVASPLTTQFIELSPEQLASLSQKRLSLQIAFPPALRRNSRPRVDLRNNLLRSRAVGHTAGYDLNLPQIHRSSSSSSLANEQHNIQMMQHLQHRGSLF